MKHFVRVTLSGSIVLLVAAWVLQSSPSRAQEKVPAPIQWEYKVITIFLPEKEGMLEKSLNELGEKGWELVSIASYSIARPGQIGNGAVVALKRVKR